MAGKETVGGEGRARALLLTAYACIVLFVFAEQWGRTTNDTRLELTETPGHFLAGTFHLWNPDVSLGEMQNQAYGYLFPHGLFFAVFDGVGVPGWVTQRLWSALLLIVACEGLRRLARAIGIGPGAAVVAGLAYALTPRHITEIGVRSSEILPGAVLPWALIPIVLLCQRRMGPWSAAILSAAAFACSGGVNGTATAAPAALLAIVVAWGVWQRHLTWRFAAGWFALIGVVSAWWAFALLRLGAYSPPFYDFVEDARTTTATSGFAAVLRGASNWVGYLTASGTRWWPAGFDLAYEPWLVLGTGLVAVLGLLGLMRMPQPWRTPLILAAVFGTTCQVIAHTGPLDSPIGQALQDLLDGPLAPLRNVAKADPVLRVPICLGVGVFAGDAWRALAGRAAGAAVPRRLQRTAAAGLLAALVGGIALAGQPLAAADTRTPGWTSIPAYWTDAATFLAERADQPGSNAGSGAAWVVPGSGFGIQQWGWTMEETMEAVGRSPWVTRSQVPLTPPETIRTLSTLETFLETGSGSPYLRHLLNRMGIDTVVVRHDLNQDVAQVPSSSLVGVALARSPGLRQVATFGRLAFGPAIEIFAVDPAVGTLTGTGGYDVRDVADTVTVAGSVEAAVAAVGSGLVGPAQPVVLAGARGWRDEAIVVGDGYRWRERAFGRIHDAESNVMAPGETYHGGRVLPNYPGAPGSRPVVARYGGIAGVDASSSRGWTNIIGPEHPEEAPWSAVDGDPTTYWRPAPFQRSAGQWLELRLTAKRRIGRVHLEEPLFDVGIDQVGAWRVSAGGKTRTVATDPATGRGSVDLDVVADRVRVQALRTPSARSGIGLAELQVDGVHPTRTLVVPRTTTDGPADLLFSARPEARACVTTLLGPDCDEYRAHASEENSGIDRTVTIGADGTWRARGLVVARSRPGTVQLLRPLNGVTMTGSSWLAQDPTVSPRMAYDATPATSWIADPRDPEPALTIDLGRARTLRRLVLTPPTGIAVTPDHAVIRAHTATGEVTRTVDLRGAGTFAPLRARRLTVDFSSSAATDGRPLGVGEIGFDGAKVAVPIDGAAPTGSVCGYGPPLIIDGRRIDTRVEGSIGDVISAGQLAVVPCGDQGIIAMRAGEHHIQMLSTEQFQPVDLTLRAQQAGTAALPSAQRSRDLRLLSASDTEVRLEVGRGEDAIISSPHNVNTGWTATIDGHRLEPIVVDGWAQGWVIPADLAGEVRLSYTPQRSYLILLIGGLALLGAVLLAALVVLVRQRVPRWRPEPPGPAAAPPRRRPLPRWLVAIGAGVIGLVVGGPVVAPAAVAGVLLARWRRGVEAVVGVALVGAVVVLAILLGDAPRMPPASVDLLTGIAVALGWAAALAPESERP